MTWFKTHWKQLAVLVLSAAVAVAVHYHPEWRDPLLAVGAVLALVGIRLPPIVFGSGTPKPPPLPMFFGALMLFLVACGAKGVATIQAGVDLVNCIDQHLGEPAPQIISECGAQEVPDIVSIIQAREALAKKRAICVTYVVDAGLPDGPGR